MSERFIIHGDKTLLGEIQVKGAKNAALKILAASLLSDQEWTIKNVPKIEDISRQIELLKGLGVEINEVQRGVYKICAKKITNSSLNPQIACKLKGSTLLAGPLLARFGQADFPEAGGCVIGQRPRDLFLAGFQALGAKLVKNKYGYHLTASKLKGAKIVFPIISVTATEAMILAAVMAEGKTRLINCACEPEIPALVDFLNQCGAKIKGAGTQIIEIEGVRNFLSGGSFKVIPDRVEAGSLIILAAATNSRVKISNIEPSHLEVFWYLLNKVGVDFRLGSDFVEIRPSSKLKAVNLKTHEYPGFATDLQPPFTVLMTQAEGMSLIHETIFEGRLFYTDILNQMGAKIIMCDPHRVIVNGPTPLYGRKLVSPDIRAGMALIIAALVARGESIIDNIYQIDRGYEKIEERLVKIGADIKRIKD